MPAEFWQWMKDSWESAPKITIINDLHKKGNFIRQILTMFWPENTSHLIMGLELENLVERELILN